MTTTDHLQVATSDRGFDSLPPVPSEYGGRVRVYESSAASGAHVWLNAKAPVDLNEPSGPTREVPIHLTAGNAWRLAEQLVALVVNHYQNDPQANWTGDERPDDAFDAARDALNAAQAQCVADIGDETFDGGVLLLELERRGFTVIRSAYQPATDETTKE